MYNSFMFWIPVISIIVFFAILIPSIVYGFFRGWRGALLISVTMIGFTAIFLVVYAFALYKVFVWPAYKKMFLERRISDQVNLNLDYLANSYKARAVLIFTGLSVPIIYIGTFLVYRILRRPLEKHLAPKTMDVVAGHEMQVVTQAKPLRSKLIGGGLLTISSVFSAGFAASAVNAMFTPENESNFGTKFSDFLGRVYSFGLGNNTPSAWAIDNFLDDMDGVVVDRVVEAVGINGTKDSSGNDFPDVVNLRKLVSEKHLLEELYKSDEATKAIFNAILNSRRHQIDPFVFSKNWATADKDSFGNQIGYNQTNRAGKYVEDLETYLADPVNAFPQELFNATTISIFKEYIKHASFIDFDELDYHQAVVNTEREIISAKEAYDKKIGELHALYSNRDTDIKERLKSLNDLALMLDPNKTTYVQNKTLVTTYSIPSMPLEVHSYTFNGNTQSYDAKYDTWQISKPFDPTIYINGSKWDTLEKDRKNLVQAELDAQAALNTAQTNKDAKEQHMMNDPTNGGASLSYIDSKSRAEHLQRQVSSDKVVFDGKTSIYNRLLSDKAEAERNIANAVSQINALTGTINNSIVSLAAHIGTSVPSGTIDSQVGQIQTRVNAYSSLKNQEYNTASSNKTNAEIAYNNLVSSLESYNRNKTDAESDIRTHTDALSRINADISHLTAHIASLTSQRQKIVNNINYSTDAKLQQQAADIQTTIDSENAKLAAKRSEKATHESALQVAQAKKTQAISDINSTTPRIEPARDAKNSALALFNSAQAEKANADKWNAQASSLSSSLSSLNNAKNLKSTNEANLSRLNGLVSSSGSIAYALKEMNDAKTVLDASTSVKDMFMNIYTPELNAFNTLKTILDQKIKEHNQSITNLNNKMTEIADAKTKIANLYSGITTLNASIMDFSGKMQDLMSQKLYTDKSITTSGEIAQNTLAQGDNDGSIAYAEILIRDIEAKKRNQEAIEKLALLEYAAIQNKIIAAYERWVGA